MIRLQLPKDNPIRQAIDLGRERFIGRPYNPLRPHERPKSVLALFNECYPGMPREVWNLARQFDNGELSQEARRRIKEKLMRKIYEANHER